MNFQQLRIIRETVRQNFNLTEAAKALFTSQPGVSKAIIELEEELGIDIFARHGKRIRGLTAPAKAELGDAGGWQREEIKKHTNLTPVSHF